LFCANEVQAQQITATTAGNSTGNGGTVSYTIGQVFYTTNQSTTGVITQGVQQPYEILIVAGFEAIEGIDLEMVIYPNPTPDYLNLIIKDYEPENFMYLLYDLSGKLLLGHEIIDKETVIPTGNLIPGEYYLKITDRNKEIKVFKIIKN